MADNIGKPPRYSIITPTICRDTLIRTCESIDKQTNHSWEHIIMVDVPLVFDKQKRDLIESLPKDPRRKIYRCGKSHKNFGNACRHNAWDHCHGDFLLYIDDDDFYADDKVLETFEQVDKQWAIFPCLRVGTYWLLEPPGIDKTGSAMFIHKRECGRYHDPDRADYEQLWNFDDCRTFNELKQRYPQMASNDNGWRWIRYAADGLTVEELKAKYPEYQVISGRPLTIYNCANHGK